MLPKYSCICGFLLEYSQSTKSYTYIKLSFSQKITNANSVLVMGVIVCLTPLSMLWFGLMWACAGFSPTVATPKFICAAALFCPEDSIALLSTASVSYSFGPLFHNDPWALDGGGASVCVFPLGMCTLPSLTLHSGCLQLSVFITVYKQKHLRWELRDVKW